MNSITVFLCPVLAVDDTVIPGAFLQGGDRTFLVVVAATFVLAVGLVIAGGRRTLQGRRQPEELSPNPGKPNAERDQCSSFCR